MSSGCSAFIVLHIWSVFKATANRRVELTNWALAGGEGGWETKVNRMMSCSGLCTFPVTPLHAILVENCISLSVCKEGTLAWLSSVYSMK